MEEGKKRNRWADSLSEAGLLDDIEDSWALPEDKPIDGSTITVEGSPGEGDSTSEPESEQGGAEPVEAPDGAGAGQLPQTPVERKRSSDPKPTAPTAEVQAPMVQPRRPSRLSAPAPIPSAKQTMSGIPSGIPHAPSRPPSDPPIELDILDRAPAATPAAEPEKAAVIEVRGSRISVPPDAYEAPQEGQAEIVDAPPVEVADDPPPREQMSQRYEAGDYSGALEIAEELLREDPHDPEALRFSESCREVLIQMYEARIGPFDRVPRVAVSEHELIWRNLDPAAGFVLSRIDGFSTFEDIIDISGLPRFETCRILGQLLQEGIIE
jgi:hypothetical protein